MDEKNMLRSGKIMLNFKKKSLVHRVTSKEIELPRDKHIENVVKAVETHVSRDKHYYWLVEKLQFRPVTTHAVIAFKAVLLLHTVSRHPLLESYVSATFLPFLLQVIRAWKPIAEDLMPSIGIDGDQEYLRECIVEYATFVRQRIECLVFLTEIVNGLWRLKLNPALDKCTLSVEEVLDRLVSLLASMVLAFTRLLQRRTSMYFTLHVFGMRECLTEGPQLLTTILELLSLPLMCEARRSMSPGRKSASTTASHRSLEHFKAPVFSFLGHYTDLLETSYLLSARYPILALEILDCKKELLRVSSIAGQLFQQETKPAAGYFSTVKQSLSDYTDSQVHNNKNNVLQTITNRGHNQKNLIEEVEHSQISPPNKVKVFSDIDETTYRRTHATSSPSRSEVLCGDWSNGKQRSGQRKLSTEHRKAIWWQRGMSAIARQRSKSATRQRNVIRSGHERTSSSKKLTPTTLSIHETPMKHEECANIPNPQTTTIIKQSAHQSAAETGRLSSNMAHRVDKSCSESRLDINGGQGAAAFVATEAPTTTPFRSPTPLPNASRHWYSNASFLTSTKPLAISPSVNEREEITQKVASYETLNLTHHRQPHFSKSQTVSFHHQDRQYEAKNEPSSDTTHVEDTRYSPNIMNGRTDRDHNIASSMDVREGSFSVYQNTSSLNVADRLQTGLATEKEQLTDKNEQSTVTPMSSHHRASAIHQTSNNIKENLILKSQSAISSSQGYPSWQQQQQQHCQINQQDYTPVYRHRQSSHSPQKIVNASSRQNVSHYHRKSDSKIEVTPERDFCHITSMSGSHRTKNTWDGQFVSFGGSCDNKAEPFCGIPKIIQGVRETLGLVEKRSVPNLPSVHSTTTSWITTKDVHKERTGSKPRFIRELHRPRPSQMLGKASAVSHPSSSRSLKGKHMCYQAVVPKVIDKRRSHSADRGGPQSPKAKVLAGIRCLKAIPQSTSEIPADAIGTIRVIGTEKWGGQITHVGPNEYRGCSRSAILTQSVPVHAAVPLFTNEENTGQKSDGSAIRMMSASRKTQPMIKSRVQKQSSNKSSKVLQQGGPSSSSPGRRAKAQVVDVVPNELEVNLQDLQIQKLIGRGGTSKVYKGKWRGADVAIKSLLLESNELLLSGKQRATAFKEFFRELGIIIRLRHPNLVLLMGMSTQTKPLFLVTEFCSGGNLFELLHGSIKDGDSRCPKFQLSWSQKIKICLDIAKAVLYLHTSSPAIIHRDIKSLNVLLSSKVESQADVPLAKVSDFGLSRIKVNPLAWGCLTRVAGTYHWMAPEVLLKQHYTEKADVYSYAIVMFEVLSQTLPYKESKSSSMGIAIDVSKGKRPDITKIPCGLPDELM